MEPSHERRIRKLEDAQLIAKARESQQREIDDLNRRRRTELVAWLALLISVASIIFNIVDNLA